MSLSIEYIQPLLVYAEEEGSRMRCGFRALDSTEVIESSGTLRRINDLQSNVSRMVKRQVSNQLRVEASRMLRSVLGGGFLGRTGAMILNTTTRNVTQNAINTFSDEEREAAIVEAFTRVADRFQFDPQQRVWRAAAPAAAAGGPARIQINMRQKPQSAFEKQLERHPVQSRYDREILVRFLIEMARADDRDYITSYIGSDLGDVQALVNQPPLTPVECESVAAGVRETIYLLGWIEALADQELTERETQLLHEYAGMFQLRAHQAEELAQTARFHALEGLIDADTDRVELFRLGEALGLSEDDALRCQIGLKKRL
ncbi:MAG: hypothetical protein SF053_15995 [Bacteroidia bacterium]|nr:hypothetical protein [Bacteroidia bacterium]